ncbi:MAG: membrane protein insertion efficiency factor YidD [Hyphomicrobiaceae bacterium]
MAAGARCGRCGSARPAGSASEPRRTAFGLVARRLLQAPVHLYRWTLKPFVGWPCRHLPTCSEYALEAIEVNGAWRGLWLTMSRLVRCNPWGTAGIDPVPDLRREHHPLAPWRYGRWSGHHIAVKWPDR